MTTTATKKTAAKAPAAKKPAAAAAATPAKPVAKPVAKPAAKAAAKPVTRAAPVKKAAPSTVKAVDALKAAADTATETAHQTAIESTEAIAASVETTVQAANERYEEAVEQMDKFDAMSREIVEAFFEAGEAAAKTAEEMSESLRVFSEKMMDTYQTTAGKLSEGSSVQDTMELQSTLIKTSYDGTVEEMSRLSELYVRGMSDVMHPFNKHVSHLVSTLTSTR